MRSDIEILKNLYLPEIEEIYPFAPGLKTSIQQEAFWEYFNTILFDTNEIANFLYSFKIAETANFISRFEQLKKEYISYLVEDYLNGETNPTIELLLKTEYQPFIEEVTFQNELKQAVITTERENLKKKLSLMDEAASFEISDNEITSAFQLLEKKNEHEKLKKKMQEWDKVEQPTYNLVRKPSRTISLSFIKYAVAACFVGAMVWVGINFYNTRPKENNVAVNKPTNTKTPTPVTPLPEFAKAEVIERIKPLMRENGLGFAQGTANIKIVFINLKPKIASIEKCIVEKGAGTNPQDKMYGSIYSELDSLKSLKTSYLFDGKSLQIITTTDINLKNEILKTTDSHYYYKEGDNYFEMLLADKPMTFVKVTDNGLIDKLNRIVFDNEK